MMPSALELALHDTCPAEAEWIEYALDEMAEGLRREALEMHLAGGCKPCANTLADAKAFLDPGANLPKLDLAREHTAFQDRYGLAPKPNRITKSSLPAWVGVAVGVAMVTGAAYWIYSSNSGAEDDEAVIARLERELKAPRLGAGAVVDLQPGEERMDVPQAAAQTFRLHLPPAGRWDVEILNAGAKPVSGAVGLERTADRTLDITASGLEAGAEYEIRAKSGDSPPIVFLIRVVTGR